MDFGFELGVYQNPISKKLPNFVLSKVIRDYLALNLSLFDD